MSKQVTESKFKEEVEKLGYYVDKLQVNPFAFTSVVSDYLIQTKEFDIACEVKEVRMKNRKTEPKFKISRITQETKLFQFEKRLYRNKSFIFICWWSGSKENSKTYLFPLSKWLDFRRKFKKSEIDLDYFSEIFSDYIVKVEFGCWKLVFE